MTSLKDIIELAKKDSGKFFVMDESGEVQLVIMGTADFEKMMNRPQVPVKPVVDIEEVNQKITKAQLTEETTPVDLGPAVHVQRPRVDMRAEVIDPSFDFDSPQGLGVEEF